jgi:NADH dehydrogenase
MATRDVATVFGGSGFLGRYVVKRLAAAGYIVRVAVRDPEGAMFLRPMGRVAQIVPLYCSLTDEPTVQRAVEGAAVVVNMVGILAERRTGDFNRIHAEGAGRIARLAAAAGVSRMVHVSAIGADAASPSLYGQSKAAGEAAVLAAFPGASIVRPSLVFGQEDQFFNRFAAMAQVLPFMPVIAGDTKMQPVYVGDVADAIMAALLGGDTAGEIYELGGPRVLTFREILAYILTVTRRKRRLVNIPLSIARFQASFAEKLPTKPFTRDQLLMLQKDNVVGAGAKGLGNLGVAATPLELIVPEYLERYRPGGGKLERVPA